MDKVSVIIPGRCEQYFQQTIDSAIETATGDVEVIAVIDGYVPDPPLVAKDNRVKLIHLEKSIGQRAAYNLGVRESSGKYLMKIDAHALLSPGYDEVLKSHCPDKTIVLPEMRRLDVRKWKPKPRGRTHFMYFGIDVYCHFWRDYKKREVAKVEYPHVLTGQGSCWFTTREWNEYIGLLEERIGSWGKVGIEVSLRTWLCGGQQIINKKAWQAHWFRRDDGGFTYPLDGRQVAKARNFVQQNYYFKNDAFEHQERPFKWLIEKFAPIPTWEVYLKDEYKANRVVVYYTDHHLEETLERVCRKYLFKSAAYIPVIGVTQKPVPGFEKNICVGPKPRNYISLYEQVIAGLEAAPKGSVVYLAEHDVIYHQSHFALLPKSNNAVYYNKNRYYWKPMLGDYLPARGDKPMSHIVADRDYLLKCANEQLRRLRSGEITTGKLFSRWFQFRSEKPNIDIRHGQNFSSKGHYKGSYFRGKNRKSVKNLPGWGSPGHFAKKIGYKGTLRTDIINELIVQNKYKTYLEIGIRNPKDNFDRVLASDKDGVDPAGKCNNVMTSDDFFARNKKKYDIIFIDGLHEADQVTRDFDNSLACLNKNGVIVMHDCNPETEEIQQMPRNGRKVWSGDVWKAFVRLRMRSDLSMYVVDTNNGVGIVRKGTQEPLVISDKLDYGYLNANRKKLLNLCSIETFRKLEGVKMHATSMKNMIHFFNSFVKPGNNILDVGSYQLDGQPSYRELVSEGSSYKGVDLREGPNVDLVLSSPYSWPELPDGSFDIVISGQTFEHTECFWLLFKEIVRVTKQKGFICIIVPTRVKIHRYPIDCWRILPDGMKTLAKIGKVKLLETYRDAETKWEDCVGIFQK